MADKIQNAYKTSKNILAKWCATRQENNEK